MRFLITRCTVYDQAGVAMILGAMNGLSRWFPDSQYMALVHPEHDSPKAVCLTTQRADEGFRWADVILDIGGLCRGMDRERLGYINLAKEMDKPYIYMAQSFHNPDPSIVKDIPAVARGRNSANEYFIATGEVPLVGADLSFLLEPDPVDDHPYEIGFTTDMPKDYSGMYNHIVEGRSVQIVWKPPRGRIYEPPLGLPTFTGSPAELFGMIGSLKSLHTCRYHSAVGAIISGVPCQFYVDYMDKYNDLREMEGKPRSHQLAMAMNSVAKVMEVVYGSRRGIGTEEKL